MGPLTTEAMNLLENTFLGSREIVQRLKTLDKAKAATRSRSHYSLSIARARRFLGLNKVAIDAARREIQIRQNFNELIARLREKKRPLNSLTVLASKNGYFSERMAIELFAEHLFTHNFDLFQVMGKTGLTEKHALEIRARVI